MSKGKISAVINAHREGLVCVPSLRSFKCAVKRAQLDGWDVEEIVVIDNGDDLTRTIIDSELSPTVNVIETSYSDLGRARNAAVKFAKGEYVAFLDADDLWGENWLTLAAESANRSLPSVVWHPEVSVYFGAAEFLFFHVDMDSEDYEPIGLLVENYWTALSFARRDLYLENPYPWTDLHNGIGFEDWAWNMSTISNGAKHKIVPNTGHAVRRKENSLSRETSSAKALPDPGHYLEFIMSSK